MIESEIKKVKKKKPRDTNKNWTAGRPNAITPDTILKLEKAFSYWLTDEEACFEANVSTTAFYDYQAKNPEFKERKEIFKKSPNIAAKKVWADEINGGNYQASKEWLERRDKEHFSTRQEVEQNSKVELKAELSALDSLNSLLEG